MLRRTRRIFRWLFIILFFALLLGGGMLVTSLTNNYDYQNKTRMFNTVEDLSFLDDKVVDTVQDKHIAKLSPAASKTVKVEYEGKTYSIFAYEFQSQEDSFAYGQAVSGNNYQKAYETSGDTAGRYYRYSAAVVIPISNKLLVFNGNNALYIETKSVKKKQFNQFVDYLFTNLPQKVEGIQ